MHEEALGCRSGTHGSIPRDHLPCAGDVCQRGAHPEVGGTDQRRGVIRDGDRGHRHVCPPLVRPGGHQRVRCRLPLEQLEGSGQQNRQRVPRDRDRADGIDQVLRRSVGQRVRQSLRVAGTDELHFHHREGSHASADSYAYPNPNADAHPDVDAHSDPDPDTHPDLNPDTYRDPNADPDVDAHADADPHSDVDPDPDFHPDPDPDAYGALRSGAVVLHHTGAELRRE